MKTNETNEVKITFTMVDDNLLSTPISRITAQQKLLISWVLRFQKNKLECFASNKTIADTFGMSKDGVKSLLKSCSHSFPTFFTCTPDTRDNGVPFHTISIDLEKLMDFIVDGAPVSKIQRRNKPSTENKAPELTIISQPIVEVQKEEIVSEIDYNELEIDISVIFSDAMRIDGKIDDEKFDYFSEVIRKLKINIPNFEGSFIKYKTLKQIKPLIDSTNVNDDFKIDCYDCIDKFNPYEYKESDYQIMCNNLNKKELV